jgi:hypothetical protein
MLIALFMIPSLKNAFSNVIGYWAIAYKASNILADIFIDKDINSQIEKETNSKNKEELTTAADTIIKIIGNKSILINQFNVENFSTLWKTMKPLMKPQYRDESENTLKIKQDLLDLVIRKENVGEFCWYLYTGILISSIVYYNLASKGCPQDVTAINNQQKIYLNKQEENKKNEKLKNKTVYSS